MESKTNESFVGDACALKSAKCYFCGITVVKCVGQRGHLSHVQKKRYNRSFDTSATSFTQNYTVLTNKLPSYF